MWDRLVVCFFTVILLALGANLAIAAVPIFGPETYIRKTGAPQTIIKSFSIQNPDGEFTLVVQNGKVKGERVSSAVIELNGIQMVGPSEFNKQVDVITKPVVLQQQNKLAVELRSQPGSSLIVTVFGNELVLVLTEPDPNGFDREVFSSDGSNTSEIFEAANYLQAGFRLAQSEGGENFVSDWDKFLEIVNLLKNTADSIHGIPLLITKAQFAAPQAMPGSKTFFMAALAAKTIFHKDITILTSGALLLSDDPVESILLQVEGTTVTVDPSGNTPLHFSSGGEKTILATVRFASGFVGQNLFRVVVDVE